jgi:hypothetical protein
MSIHDRAAMLMEPVAEIDEQILSDPKTPSDEADRDDQNDIIKVKNVCRKLEFNYRCRSKLIVKFVHFC